MIARLLERTFRDRILVAAAARSLTGEALDPWRRLATDANRAIHVRLTGLEEPAVAELVAAAWPGADAALARRLWLHTSGNPLFLQAILREHTLDEVRDAEELPAPRDLVRAFTARPEQLDAAEAALLRAVVILGDQWASPRTAGALAGLDDAAGEDPAEVAGRLVRQGLLVSRGQLNRPEIRAASGVIRTAIASAIPPAERRVLHRRAAALADSPVDALRHRFLAASGHDEDLADELEAAAWSLHLARHSQQASRVGRWASEVSADPAARERRLLDALYDGVLAHDLDAAERELDHVGDVRDEARRKLVEGYSLVIRRQWAQAATVFWSVPAAALAATDERTRFRLRVLRAWTQIVTGGSADLARQELALDGAGGPAADPRLSGYFGFATAMVNGPGAGESAVRLAGEPDLGLGPDLDRDPDLTSAWQGAAAAVTGLADAAVRSLRPFVTRIDDGLLTMGEDFLQRHLERVAG